MNIKTNNNTKTFSNTTEAYNEILKEIQKLPMDVRNGAQWKLGQKLQQTNPTIEQFQRFYNNLSMIKNDVTTMEVFNRQLKNF